MEITFIFHWWYIFIPLAVLTGWQWVKCQSGSFEDGVGVALLLIIFVPFSVGVFYGHFVP